MNRGFNKNWVVLFKKYDDWFWKIVYSNGVDITHGVPFGPYPTLQAAKKSAGPLLELIEMSKYTSTHFEHKFKHPWDWRVEK